MSTDPLNHSQFEEGTTLDRFLLETLRGHPEATGQFVTLINQVTLAAKLVSARRAGEYVRCDRHHEHSG